MPDVIEKPSLSELTFTAAEEFADPLPKGTYHGSLTLDVKVISSVAYGESVRLECTFQADQVMIKGGQFETFADDTKAAGFLTGWSLGSSKSRVTRFIEEAFGEGTCKRLVACDAPVTLIDGWTGFFTVTHEKGEKNQIKAIPVNVDTDATYKAIFEGALSAYEKRRSK